MIAVRHVCSILLVPEGKIKNKEDGKTMNTFTLTRRFLLRVAVLFIILVMPFSGWAATSLLR
jgi:hypothetical protein